MKVASFPFAVLLFFYSLCLVKMQTGWLKSRPHKATAWTWDVFSVWTPILNPLRSIRQHDLFAFQTQERALHHSPPPISNQYITRRSWMSTHPVSPALYPIHSSPHVAQYGTVKAPWRGLGGGMRRIDWMFRQMWCQEHKSEHLCHFLYQWDGCTNAKKKKKKKSADPCCKLLAL